MTLHKNKYSGTIKLIMLMTEILLISFMFYLVWVNKYVPTMRVQFYRRGNYVLTILYAIVLSVCILIMRGQELGEVRVLEVGASHCIALVMCNCIMYFPLSLLQYQMLPVLPLMLLTLAQIAVMGIWVWVANMVYFTLYTPQRILVVYDREDVELSLVDKLLSFPDRYTIHDRIRVDEGQSAIREAMHDCDAVLLAVRDVEWQEWLMLLCFKRNKPLYVLPTITNVIINSSRSLHIIDSPLLTSKDHCLTLEERVIKRVMDLLIAAAALIITAPIMLLIALCIKLGDGGPVFFRQERLTRNGKLFKICKFRSMRVDAESGGQRLATADDARITPVGRVIRKLRLDELPQLFNVLSGSMSIVGPRPECPSIAADYEKKLPAFSYRLKVKAGITGYAQVFGNYDTTPEDKLLMDIMYIEQFSARRDLNLMLLTLRVLFMTDKAKGTTEKAAVNKREDSAHHTSA